jgi:FKBP-type peptidyl-prolyl cis-trans isomerase
MLALALAAAGCEQEAPAKKRGFTQEELFEINRNRVGLESEKIDKYISHYGLDMQKTSTGLRYDIFYQTTDSLARNGQFATIAYEGFLLDSTLVESTDVSGLKVFKIGEDPLISGLHEAVLLMHVGDSAKLVMPSYLAYGLTGVESTIPPNAPLYYEICLVDLR